MIDCCGEPMFVAGIYRHCRICHNKLVDVTKGVKPTISDLLVEEIQDDQIMWKELQPIIHELWRCGYYENYTPNIPKEWDDIE